MLNSVREKTEVVERRRDARTVEAIRAALVEREAGNLDHTVQSLIQVKVNSDCIIISDTKGISVMSNDTAFGIIA